MVTPLRSATRTGAIIAVMLMGSVPAIVLPACGKTSTAPVATIPSEQGPPATGLNQEGGEKPVMQLISSGFGHGGKIPRKYTADGEDVSPPLEWKGAPPETRSFALICDDPDAPVGTWVHWVLFNIPGDVTQLGEGVPPQKELPDGAKQGLNDFRKIGYGGPSPPPGRPHRYFFRLYALDAELSPAGGAKKSELVKAMEGRILATAELMGTYQR